MRIGLEQLACKGEQVRSWGKCGLLCNQASVTASFVHSIQVCHELLGERLQCLFSPQHGLDATAQDNMIESCHSQHQPSGLPIYSLYSETREPTEEMLSEIDTIIVDLQLVGCRVYTFKWTIAACIRAARKFGKKIVVLDRPNPLGGEIVEGRVLDLEAASFVGEARIPMRHGLTPAEFASFVNAGIGADLTFVLMEGWDARTMWPDLGRPWILTSPNLPSFDSVLFYPGSVIFEGTNISEGRGTGLPFQYIGAPYVLDEYGLASRLREHTGVYCRPARFEPTSGKWHGDVCKGLQLLAVQPDSVASYSVALGILSAIKEQGGCQFKWKEPPYEYNYVDNPFNLIMGSMESARTLEEGRLDDPFWHSGIEEYIAEVQPHLMYKRTMECARLAIGSGRQLF